MESVFLRLKRYGVLIIKYLFFLFNLALLAGLSVKTVNLWLSDSFKFKDTLGTFPHEPEFFNKTSAEKQFLAALGIETFLFIIGGFLCYELLIKKKTFRRSLIAPLSIVFLWTTGESVHLFFPATEKVYQINACKAMDISWDTQRHTCRLMDLELKRFEQWKKQKKAALKQAKTATAVKTNPSKTDGNKKEIKKEIAAPTKKIATKKNVSKKTAGKKEITGKQKNVIPNIQKTKTPAKETNKTLIKGTHPLRASPEKTPPSSVHPVSKKTKSEIKTVAEETAKAEIKTEIKPEAETEEKPISPALKKIH